MVRNDQQGLELFVDAAQNYLVDVEVVGITFVFDDAHKLESDH